MKYYSTNRLAPLATLEEAVVKGLAGNKGLYMPRKDKGIAIIFLRKNEGYVFSGKFHT